MTLKTKLISCIVAFMLVASLMMVGILASPTITMQMGGNVSFSHQSYNLIVRNETDDNTFQANLYVGIDGDDLISIAPGETIDVTASEIVISLYSSVSLNNFDNIITNQLNSNTFNSSNLEKVSFYAPNYDTLFLYINSVRVAVSFGGEFSIENNEYGLVGHNYDDSLYAYEYLTLTLQYDITMVVDSAFN